MIRTDQQHTCISCFKPANSFYIVEGSSKYYMQILTRELGIPAEEALAMAANQAVLDGANIQAVTATVDGSVLRKVYVCVMCAARRGLVPPVNEVDLELIAEDGSGSPVRTAVFTEDVTKSVFNTGPEVLKARSEDDMRAKGADKEIMVYLQKLTERGYLWKTGGGNHYNITRVINGLALPVTSISSTPRNAGRAVLNTESKVRNFERIHGLDTNPRPRKKDSAEDYAKLMIQRPAPNAPDDEPAAARPPLMAGIGAESLSRLASLRPALEEPRRNIRTLDEKHALVSRYDTLSLDDQRDLLKREKIDHGYIRRWRDELKEARYIPPVSEPVQAEVVRMVQEPARYPEAAQSPSPPIPSRPLTPTPEQVAASTMHAQPDAETTSLMALMARKKYIIARREAIDTEKAALVRKLDEEKAALTRELEKVQDKLLAAIAE